jgi:hypothetical protein
MSEFYRPMAPSDFFGNITAELEDLDLDDEARRYALQWWEEERRMAFDIGLTYFTNRPALIFLIEAARALSAGQNNLAMKLIRLAQADLREIKKQGKKVGIECLLEEVSR